MSAQPRYWLVGAFVVASIAVILAAVTVIGSGRFLRTTHKYIMYFEGSIEGLRVGAPVTFRGVKIGEVSDISINVGKGEEGINIPVVVSTEPQSVNPDSQEQVNNEAFIKQLIDEGLRAQLHSQSLLTGLLSINLDFYPKNPARIIPLSSKYMQIPTIPSKLQEIANTLDRLPLTEIVLDLQTFIRASTRVLDNDAARQFFANLNETVSQGGGAFGDARHLLEEVSTGFEKISAGLLAAAHSVEGAAVGTQGLVSDSRMVLRGDSDFSGELRDVGRELTAAARSIRELSDSLERRPESLLYGKKRRPE